MPLGNGAPLLVGASTLNVLYTHTSQGYATCITKHNSHHYTKWKKTHILYIHIIEYNIAMEKNEIDLSVKACMC